jgi:hypothetical protein
VGTAHPFLGVDYQGGYSITPVNTFYFRVASDSDAGCFDASVTFTAGASNAQGSSLLDLSNAPVPADGGFVAFTDPLGNVSAQLQAGSHHVGPVTVHATIILPGGSAASASGSSNVVGTQPSVANSGISCATLNLPVYAGSNSPVCAVKSNYTGNTTCTVTLGDRFGNAIGISVPVHFYSEAGLWQSEIVNTPAFGDPNPMPGPGKVTNQLNTEQATLPQDVDPLPGEPSYAGTCLGLNRTFNPRDGLVTVMAAFNGEEAFDDRFALNYWQPGDPFVDLPQPFVDNDDSSVWKPGDICAGSSTDGGCDGPNHQWDGNGNVWVENRILYTSDPQSTVWNPYPGPTVYGMPVQGEITWADVNLNYPTATTVCSVSAPTSGNPQGFTCTYPILGNSANPIDTLGFTAAQIQLCDAGLVVFDGGTQMGPICNYQTVVAGFSSGFTGTYELGGSTGNDAGPTYCIQSSAKLGMGQADLSQLCGTYYGYGP